MRQHCPKCGSYQSPRPEQADLFMSRAGLPVPPSNDAFAQYHAASRQREAEAKRRAVCRAVGAERRARIEFTNQALRGVQ